MHNIGSWGHFVPHSLVVLQKKMKTTTPELLVSQGYTEDAMAGQEFERPYTWPNLVLAIIFFSSLVLTLSDRISMKVGIPLMAGSMIIICLTIIRLRFSIPYSRHTGKPMERYRNSAPKEQVCTELIYVCHESKTFFRRVFSEFSDS